MRTGGNSEASGLSHDMVTGVQTNSHRRTRLQRATTNDNLTNHDQEQSEDDDNEPGMTQLMNAITKVPTMIHSNTQKHKLLHARVPTFKEQKEDSSELEHLLLNHTRPFQKKITEGEKLQLFTSEDGIEFWQTIRVTPDTTLVEVLQMFREKNARDDFKEVSRYRWDQLKYDP